MTAPNNLPHPVQTTADQHTSIHLHRFQPGQRVRRVGAPDSVGTVLAHAIPWNGRFTQRVRFDSGSVINTDPESLEPMPESVDPIEAIERGEFSSATSLRASLLHQRLDGRLMEVIYAMEASDTTFLPYQFKPTLSLLESPTGGLLVADEVGLGKTIEAGLIWIELRQRENARTLLVVCPPHLVSKWKFELKRRFGVDAQAAGPEVVLEKLEEAQHGTTPGFALIATYHGMRPPNGWVDDPSLNSHSAKLARRLKEWSTGHEPFVDLLIMDEAAIMRNPSSRTSELGALLTEVSRFKVYLSATPVHTQSKNLYTLLNRLDPDTFSSFSSFRALLEANTPLVRLREALLNLQPDRDRVMSLLEDAKKSHLLQNSAVLAELEREIRNGADLGCHKVCSQLAYQANRANLLSHVITRTRRKDVDPAPVIRDVRTLTVPLDPIERALYDAVTDAVLEYSAKKKISAGFLTVMPQRMVASCMAAALERICGPQTFTEAETSPDIASSAALAGSPSEDKEGAPLMSFVREKLGATFSVAELRRVDTKYHNLLLALRSHWEAHPDSKVVLFAYFKPTLKYLSRRLSEDGIGSLLLTGDSAEDKQDVVNAFAASTKERILLSSEVGSEGLDIQFASTLINYDLPWNPTVVAQRIGRIHRIGQKSERILIRNIVSKDTVDDRILVRLYDRMDLFQNTIGDQEELLGEEISRLTRDLLLLKLSPEEQIALIEKQTAALQNLRIEERRLEDNAGILSAHGDYIIQKISEAHRRGDWIKGEELESYVVGFFATLFPNTEFRGLNAAERTYEIDLDPQTAHQFDEFLRKNQLRGATRIGGGDRKRIRFDHQVFKNSHGAAEVVNHSHPLVRFVNSELRRKQLVQPLAVATELPAEKRPQKLSPGIYVFVSQKWKVEGLRNVERMHHQLMHADLTPVSEENLAAECIEAAALHGVPLQNFAPQESGLLEELAQAARNLEQEAHGQFEQFLAGQQREDADRKALLAFNVDQFEQRKRQMLEEVLERHLCLGRESLAAATRGQLDALRRKSEMARAKISTRTVHGGSETIAAGFIVVH
jgi:superfamily II DNA or RNA helicase